MSNNMSNTMSNTTSNTVSNTTSNTTSTTSLPYTPDEYNRNTVNHPNKTKWFKGKRDKRVFLKDPKDYKTFGLMLKEFLMHWMGEHCQDKHNPNNKKENCMCGMDLLVNEETHKGICKMVTDYHALDTEGKKLYRWNRVKEVCDAEIARLGPEKKIQFMGKCFVLTSIPNPSDGNRPFRVCRHTFQRIMDMGDRQLNDVKTEYLKTKSNIPPPKKESNRQPSEKDQEVTDSIIEFMNELIENEGAPYASRQVRARCGRTYLRDDERDGVLLPPYLTKNAVYERWVYQRGWIARDKNKLNNYGHARVGDFQPRNDWPQGTHKEKCSRFKFDSLWKIHFKHVKIGLPAKDTCAVCWKFEEEAGRLTRQITIADPKANGSGATNTQEKDDSSDEDSVVFTEGLVAEDVGVEEEDDESAEAQPDSTPARQTRSQTRSNTNTNNSAVITPYPTDVCTVIQEPSSGQKEELFEKKERLVLQMAEHIGKFKMQREYVKEWDRFVKAQGDDVQWPNRTHMYCGDYSQNMDLPHFGGEQPGDSYYFSPLAVYLFGIADHSTDVLSAYLYHEGVGKKGGDNVVSLIHKKLKDDGIFELAEMHGAGERMIFVFDNCAGQNKNRMVLRYMQYLVDCRVFKKIEIVFLIAGHTKNICDRRFKDAKHNFHKQNVYSMDDLIDVMKQGVGGEVENDYVSVHEVYPQDFSNWDVFLDKYYAKKISEVTKQHWFYYSDEASGYVEKRIVVHEVPVPPKKPNKQKLTKLKKTATDEEKRVWFDNIKNDSPQPKDPPGIPDIKRVELYEKWRRLVPVSYQQEMCPDPGLEVRNKVKSAAKDRKERRNAERNGQN